MTDPAHPVDLITEVTLRYSDLDPLGHLNNAVYATLFEAGRVDFVERELASALTPAFGFVLARIEIDFRAEGHFPGMARIETGIARIGRTSMDFDQKVTLEGRELAAARSVCVLLDLRLRAPAPWPEDARAVLKDWLGRR
jgi:acyl-CoA thioester hydrolase